MDIDGLVELVKQSNDFNKINFERLESIVNAQNTRSRAIIEDFHDCIVKKIDEVKAKQDISNGKIFKNEKDITKLNDVTIPGINAKIIESGRMVKWIKKHPGKCFIIFFMINFGIYFLLDKYPISEIWKFIKSLI